jgi:hypothetical protein
VLACIYILLPLPFQRVGRVAAVVHFDAMFKQLLSGQVERLMDWVVPDVDTCRHAAAEMLVRDPAARREDLALAIVNAAKQRGVAVGGVTGILSNPFSMVPATIADVGAMLKIEGTMAGTIAALLDPASLDDPAQFRADVMAVVFPAAVSQALRQVGIRAGERFTKHLVRRAVGTGGLETLVKIASKVLGTRLTGKSILGHGLPLVSPGIGAGWNWLEVTAVGNRAIAYHSGQPVGAGKLRGLRDRVRKLRSGVQKRLE